METLDPSSAVFKHISDTARFVALLRAQESERPDAHFKDHYARKLAGPGAEVLLKQLSQHGRFDTRTMAVRTQVLDERITEVILSDKIERVVNLAAGLDTRPYRLSLPAELSWVEVDYPEVLSYKQTELSKETPRCRLELRPADLAQNGARQELIASLGADGKRTLVLTEGLLMYLPVEQVKALAQELHAQGSFKHWMMDLLSPQWMKMLKKRLGKQFDAAHSSVYFGPEEGAEFFRPFGWKLESYDSFAREAYRLDRETFTERMVRVTGGWLSAERRASFYRQYGAVWLTRT